MKEYLKERLDSLKKEYVDLLTQVGDTKDLIVGHPLWTQVEDKKSRIDEVKMITEFFNDNNYVNS